MQEQRARDRAEKQAALEAQRTKSKQREESILAAQKAKSKVVIEEITDEEAVLLEAGESCKDDNKLKPVRASSLSPLRNIVEK